MLISQMFISYVEKAIFQHFYKLKSNLKSLFICNPKINFDFTTNRSFIFPSQCKLEVWTFYITKNFRDIQKISHGNLNKESISLPILTKRNNNNINYWKI